MGALHRSLCQLFIAATFLIFSNRAMAGDPPVPSQLAWTTSSGSLNCTWKAKKVDGWKVSINGPRGFSPVAGVRIDGAQNWYTVGQEAELPNGPYKCIVRSVKNNQESDDKKKSYTLTTGKPPATPQPSNPTPTATAVPTATVVPTATPNSGCLPDYAPYQSGKSCCSGYSTKIRREQPMGPILPTRFCVPSGFQCPATDQVAPKLPGEGFSYCCESQRLAFMSRVGEGGDYYCKDMGFRCPSQPDAAGFCCGKAYEIVAWSFEGGQCKLDTEVSYGCGTFDDTGRQMIYVPPGFTLKDSLLRQKLSCANPGDCYGIKVCK